MVAQIDKAYLRRRPTRLWPRMLSYAFFEGRPLTTRGRWINPLVFALARLLSSLPSLRRVEAPVFILGTGRSGTTILGIVLSMHRDVGFLNEPKALWAGLFPNEDLIGNYNRNPAQYRLDAQAATPSLVRRAHRIFGAYLRLSGTRRVVDKYPELIFRTGFVRAIFPDAKFLFLSRNGIETCVSIRRWSERLGQRVGGETHDWWGVDDRKWKMLLEQIIPEHPDLAAHTNKLAGLDQEARAAVEWIVTMREGMRLTAADPRRTLHVPYASLCADPRGWATRLETFLGLPSDLVFEDYASATLSNPSRDLKMPLPGWLAPIFADVQARLDKLE